MGLVEVLDVDGTVGELAARGAVELVDGVGGALDGLVVELD